MITPKGLNNNTKRRKSLIYSYEHPLLVIWQNVKVQYNCPLIRWSKPTLRVHICLINTMHRASIHRANAASQSQIPWQLCNPRIFQWRQTKKKTHQIKNRQRHITRISFWYINKKIYKYRPNIRHRLFNVIFRVQCVYICCATVDKYFFRCVLFCLCVFVGPKLAQFILSNW